MRDFLTRLLSFLRESLSYFFLSHFCFWPSTTLGGLTNLTALTSFHFFRHFGNFFANRNNFFWVSYRRICHIITDSVTTTVHLGNTLEATFSFKLDPVCTLLRNLKTLHGWGFFFFWKHNIHIIDYKFNYLTVLHYWRFFSSGIYIFF